MLATLTAALLLGSPATVEPARADKDAPAPTLELFANENWYKSQKGDEQEFVGVLSKAVEPPGGTVGFGRFNLYRLTMNDNGKQVVREVYSGSHPELLAPYVGKRVKLTGKAVDTEVEGRVYAEIWPARLVVLDAETAPETPLAPAAPPARLDLLAGNKVYLADPTPEKDYVGDLEKKKGVDAVGYRLVIDAGDAIDRQDVHLFNEHYDILDPYNGMRVKITGKKVTGMVRGTAVSYILPARLEVLSGVGTKPPGKAKELKVLARTEWPAEGAAPLRFVIRSARELAVAHGQSADRATDETVQTREAELAARLFKVETIDWRTQMIILVSAGAMPTTGYRVEITGLPVQDDVLTVHWQLISPRPGDFVKETATNPAQAVLTDRFDGTARFEAPPKPPAAGK